MTILLWIAGIAVILGALGYAALVAAFAIVNRLPDVGDYE